ncbi:MAG: tetratricopeptide repeat protein [Ignavibacteriaceae bacterium]|jgi:tetratricopeptide (TPR) repeat protein
MLKTITLIVFITLTQILAQGSIDTLRSNDKKVQEALNYYNQKNYEKAQAMLEIIIDSNEKNAEAHYYLGYTLFMLKNLDGAIEECERAVELDNDNADYHYDLGRLYGEDANDASIFRLPFLAGNIKDEAKTALRLNPNHLGARILLANFYFQAPGIFGGSYDKAIEHATIAAKLDEWQGRILLIRIYNELEEYNKAENECKLLENIESDNQELQLVLFNEYGSLLIEQNRINEAIEKYKKTVTLAPEKSWTHNSLGNAYLLKGKYDEAVAEFNIALTINPDSEYAKEKLEETNEKRNNK